jgi:hypothetical protein
MINQHVQQILERLLTALDQIDISSGTPLPALLECVRHCVSAVKELEAILLDYQFSDQEEEIMFFKVLKPQVEGRMIYYLRLTGILQLAPVSDAEQRRNYLKTHLVSIEQFYRDHAEMHLYYRMEYQYLDSYYFVRSTEQDLVYADGAMLVADQRVHSRKSNLFSYFFAFHLLAIYLNGQLSDDPWDPARRTEDDIIWTGTQAEAVEQIYAWNEAGVLNGRPQDVSKVVRWFERAFRFRISNVYATHEDNRMRKKNRTPFCDRLKNKLIDKYEYDDLHAL